MDAGFVEAATQLINGVGFPVAAFVAMYWMCNSTLRDVQTTLVKLSGLIESLTVKVDSIDKNN